MHWKRSRLTAFLCLVAILIINQGCSQTTNLFGALPEETGTPVSIAKTDTDDEKDSVGEFGEDDQPGNVGREAMVFVVDPDYNPIPNAVIGTNREYADMSGVFYGEVTANESGWVPVQAAGYVSNYAKPSPYSGEYDLYFVTLAPVGAAFYYQESSGSHLQLAEQEAPHLEVDLEPGALTEGEGYLEITELDPREICMDDAWAELDDPFGAILSFDISAWNLDGEPINLAEGKTALINYSG